MGRKRRIHNIESLAARAAAAHGVAAKVTVHDHLDGNNNPTGRLVVSVVFFQDCLFRPEGGGYFPVIENRRFVGISQGDASRLYAARHGYAGGQAYVELRTARRVFMEVCEDVQTGKDRLAVIARSGAFRVAAHAVADQAARNEIAMRDQLRNDLAQLWGDGREDLDALDDADQQARDEADHATAMDSMLEAKAKARRDKVLNDLALGAED